MSGYKHTLCRVNRRNGIIAFLRRRGFSSTSRAAHEHNKRVREAGEEARDLYLSVLRSTSTKREAKSYLQRFKPKSTAPTGASTADGAEVIVETGSSSTLAPNHGPISSLITQSGQHELLLPGSLHKMQNREFIRGLLRKSRPHAFEQFSEDCFAPNISDHHIHLSIVKLRGPQHLTDEELAAIGRTLKKLGRLGLGSVVVVDVNEDGKPGAPEKLDPEMRAFHILQMNRVVAAIEAAGAQARSVEGSLSIDHNGDSHVLLPSLILAPTSRGAIPVIPSLAHDHKQRLKPTSPDSILIALCQLLTDINHEAKSSFWKSVNGESPKELMTLDRIMVLDPLGGIPSYDRPSGAHVFLNLEQEYKPVLTELRTNKTPVSPTHISTLKALRECLKLLPSTTSAVVTTPQAAMTETGPLAPRNPLIHNLLTDKPVFSSSLPITPSTPRVLTTLLKHGVPVTCLPPTDFENGVTLSTHPKINLKRLVELIEDSFGKTLDVQHYLSRINDSVAGVVLAGDYDGAAIITWEAGHNGRKVAYLDKFAVARKAQGTGGVADVVFKAMLSGEGMFGRELIWRSRQGNPVNKWYFERAKGSYKLRGGKWTMFWTTEGLLGDANGGSSDGGARFEEYLGICERIVPSLQE